MKLILAVLLVGSVYSGSLRTDLNALTSEVNTLQGQVADLSGLVGHFQSYAREEVWHLGMNLNPADNHVMGYATGWATGDQIGSEAAALSMDYLNKNVWKEPANYIAIARHNHGELVAVKVFQFKYWGSSLLQRFQDMDPGRMIVTEGGPIQESVAADAKNLVDDPIFSVEGDLAFNWGYTDNGHRVVLTGGYLSAVDANDDNTHGLGNDFWCNYLRGTSNGGGVWAHEISNIQDCPLATCRDVQVQGTDHGSGGHLKSGPVYGNYAIYVSKDAATFPLPGAQLGLTMEVIP